jgi:hypothetical protein
LPQAVEIKKTLIYIYSVIAHREARWNVAIQSSLIPLAF